MAFKLPGVIRGGVMMRSKQPMGPSASWNRGPAPTRRCVAPPPHSFDPSSSFDPPEAHVDVDSLDRVRRMLPDLSDTNQLETALTAAIMAEDYALAASVRDKLSLVMGAEGVDRIDWSSLGLPEWLIDRVVRLGFRFPTEVQRRASPVILSGSDTIIQSATGSGKSLAFLAATLARLDYPPELLPGDLDGPQAIILVPTMELGVQCSLMVFKMFGGNLVPGLPGDPTNMFSYFGPKGIQVRGLLNKEEVVRAMKTSYLDGVHVVVATPAALLQVYTGKGSKPILSDLKVLAIDEYDECFNQSPEAMALLMASACSETVSENKPQMVLVGATIEQHQLEDALSAGWIKDPVQIVVGKELSVPSALQHRFMVCDTNRRLVTLVRMLREDLKKGNEDGTPVRAIVFANSVEEAAAIAEPLYSSLWNEHVIAIMLPTGTPLPWSESSSLSAPPAEGGDSVDAASDGIVQNSEVQIGLTKDELVGSAPFSAREPIVALHAFRDNLATLLLCTPQAARGLDLPSVSHVYNLGCPSGTSQYLHQAGRTGRIGSTLGGVVTTIIFPDEGPQMLEIAEQLVLDIAKREEGASDPLLSGIGLDGSEADDGSEGTRPELGPGDVDKLRKGFDDIFNLM